MAVEIPISDTVDNVLMRIDAIDPARYDKTRNYLDGAVTWLSPYITHGVINTSIVAERVLANHAPKSCYRLLYELAWREYFHRIWQERDNDIFFDMYHPQAGAESNLLPSAILAANTGIDVLDEGLKEVQRTGLMHNHMRMWVAGIVCNVAHTDWKLPAKWLYYHLLDGDLASNTLSWQWIAGTFSNKQYIANQDNLNKYSRSLQQGTWLDVSYETLAELPTPEVLRPRENELELMQSVPGLKPTEWLPKQIEEIEQIEQRVQGDLGDLGRIENGQEQLKRRKIGLRSLWNLNPDWLNDDVDVLQVMFIEQEQINAWPMSEHRWAFIQHWVDQLEIDVWLGSVEDLNQLESCGIQFIREEYPACAHWPGTITERPFHFSVPTEEYRSFSQFWKKVR